MSEIDEQKDGKEPSMNDSCDSKTEDKKVNPINVPNTLTIIRIILIPVFVVLFFVPFPWHRLTAMIVFAAACVTDFFDGLIARKCHMITNLGKFLDPIADKLIVACSLIAVCITPPPVPHANVFFVSVAVFTMVIISRELMISGFRIIAAGKGIVLAADLSGKAKTLLQMVALVLILPVAEYAEVNAPAAEIVYYTAFSLLAAATAMTVISGVHYIVSNRTVLEG